MWKLWAFKNSLWPTFSRCFEYLIGFQILLTAQRLVMKLSHHPCFSTYVASVHLKIFKHLQLRRLSTDLDEIGIKNHGILKYFI